MRQSWQLTSIAILASLGLTQAGKILETDAFITPKTKNRADTQIGNHLLNLEAVIDEDEIDSNEMNEAIVDDPGRIVTTKDIDNYFNLQITTKVYIGSEQEAHDLILDTGSMVSLSSQIQSYQGI